MPPLWLLQQGEGCAERFPLDLTAIKTLPILNHDTPWRIYKRGDPGLRPAALSFALKFNRGGKGVEQTPS